MSSFVDLMASMAMLTDEQMAVPWRWRPDGEVLQVRDAFHRTLEAEQVQVSLTAASGAGEVTAAYLLAQRAAGDLCGLLAGLPGDILDRAAPPGEWSLRDTIRHVIETEAHFRVKTLWAVDRAADDPLDPPEALQPRAADVSGDASAWIALLLEERAITDDSFIRVTSDDLARPSTWVGHAVDGRFRLHRPASHLVEHTNQCEKILHALGKDPGEARQLVRAIWATRGAHERVSEPEALFRLDGELAARLETLPI